MLHPFIDTVLYFARVPQLRRYVIGSIFRTQHTTGHISNSLVLLSAATAGLNPQRRNYDYDPIVKPHPRLIKTTNYIVDQAHRNDIFSDGQHFEITNL